MRHADTRRPGQGARKCPGRAQAQGGTLPVPGRRVKALPGRVAADGTSHDRVQVTRSRDRRLGSCAHVTRRQHGAIRHLLADSDMVSWYLDGRGFANILDLQRCHCYAQSSRWMRSQWGEQRCRSGRHRLRQPRLDSKTRWLHASPSSPGTWIRQVPAPGLCTKAPRVNVCGFRHVCPRTRYRVPRRIYVQPQPLTWVTR